ncbi:MAG: hypothetical protein D6805_03675 [Planctomycetota bacterium]|nr:MAG: hypothetical protein D6805_03675 [Planctomycetota bacterium]
MENHPLPKIYLLLLVLWPLSCSVLLSTLPVRNIMEARNLKSAQEILDSQHWLLPTLNGKPRIKKPPLPTWAAAASAKISGSNHLFFLRLPNLFMGILFLAAFYLLTQNLFGKQYALLPTLMLLTSAQLLAEIPTARWDLFATALGLAALWATCRCLHHRRSLNPYLPLSILLWTASYLSKGPLAFYLIALPFFSTTLLAQTLLKPSSPPFPALPDLSFQKIFQLLLILTISLGFGNLWWLAIYLQQPNTWKILYADMVSLNQGHAKPVYYYVLRSLALMAPWSPLFLAALFQLRQEIRIVRKFFGKIPTATPSTQSLSIPHWNLLFSITWFLLAFALLSAVPAKKSRYFLSLLPPACLMATFAWQNYRYLLSPLYHYSSSLLYFSLPPLAFYLLWKTGPHWTNLPLPLLWLTALPLFLRKENPLEKTSIALLLTLLLLPQTLQLLPPYQQNKYHQALKLRPLLQHQKIYLLGHASPQLLWALNAYLLPLPSLQQIPTPSPISYLLVEETNHTPLPNFPNLVKIYSFTIHKSHKKLQHWHLYRISPTTPKKKGQKHDHHRKPNQTIPKLHRP